MDPLRLLFFVDERRAPLHREVLEPETDLGPLP
jgi:hypothetical protein